MTLGDIIRNYRENNNITLGEFANACSLSKGYISMLENNINPRNNKPISPTLPSMAKVASGMGIDLDTLLKMLDKKQLQRSTEGLIVRLQTNVCRFLSISSICGKGSGSAVHPRILSRCRNTYNFSPSVR